MNIQAVMKSVQKLHGDTRDQAAKHDSFLAWQAARKPPAPKQDGIPTVRSPRGYMVPDYSKPGVAEQVRQSVDEAYDEHYSISKTRS